MKKIVYLIFISVILLTSCEKNDQSSNSDADNTSSNIMEISQQTEDVYKDLGIPLEKRYTFSQRAIIPWDMIVFDNNLYIGSGDWQNNSGPVDMWRYDIKNKKWENSGSVPDEEVNKFLIIDEKLTVPGTDPRAGWELGNYYVLNNDKWETIRTIPNAIHCFDLAEYDGKLFAALGVENHYPVAVSSDGGKTFKEVEFYKDGNSLYNRLSNIFLYDIFVLNDKLYAFFQDEIYVYDGSSFNCIYDLKNKLVSASVIPKEILGKVCFKNKLYFTTGYLFSYNDTDALKYIKSPQNEIVYDVYTDNESLYILCGKKTNENDYIITVYKSASGEENSFEKVIDFRYEIPALSFAFSSNSIYFGMYKSGNNNNGRILEMEILK